MPTRTNERGILEWISNDHARALAGECLARNEARAERARQYGYLSDRDRRDLRDDDAEAERLLRESGDWKDRPIYSRFVPVQEVDDDDEPQPARLSREEARDRAQAVWDTFKKVTRRIETKSGESANYPQDPTGMIRYDGQPD